MATLFATTTVQASTTRGPLVGARSTRTATAVHNEAVYNATTPDENAVRVGGADVTAASGGILVRAGGSTTITTKAALHVIAFNGTPKISAWEDYF